MEWIVLIILLGLVFLGRYEVVFILIIFRIKVLLKCVDKMIMGMFGKCFCINLVVFILLSIGIFILSSKI